MSEDFESQLRSHLASVDGAPVTGSGAMAAAVARVTRRKHRRRQVAFAVASVAVVATVGVVVWSTRPDTSGLVVSGIDSTPLTLPKASSTTAVPGSSTTLSPANSWATLPADPRGAPFAPFVVWTGHEAITVGGSDARKAPVAGASAYDPATRSWRTLADPPNGWERVNALVAWTGAKMLIIGGQTPDGAQSMHSAIAYSPVADEWTIASPPCGSLNNRTPSDWTGTELLAWPADTGCASSSSTPVAYNPTTNTWRELARPPIVSRDQSASVWTGTEWIVWGGSTSKAELGDGAAYNPSTNSWRVLATSPLSPRRVRAVWTGTEMLIAAGSSGGDRQTGNGELALADGAAYNPTTDTWRPIASGLAHPGFTPLWTGSEMIMFAKRGAAVYDAASDQWSDNCCNETDATGSQSGDTPVWTGSVMLLIGTTDPKVGGAAFTPPAPVVSTSTS
jgi:hypothetical protein